MIGSFCLRYVCAFLSASLLCLAQSAGAGAVVQGTVKDSSSAVIPGAKLRIQHMATGVVTATVTNGDGYYSTPSIQIGRYQIRVEATGMKAWEGEVVLETGRTVELNPTLAPGQVSETITVSESIPLVTTTDPTEGSTLDSKRIQELPINGRDLNTLIGDVAPGVEQVIDVNGGIRSGGLMAYSNDYIQDGASSNNREFGGSMNLQGLESIAEVRVETSTSSARYNRPTSVIVTTRGGTNSVRGSIYETMRNNSFGVARARQDVFYDGRVYQTPKLIRNEFGGSIGGPVWLPKLYNGRNRTFFFFSREGVELRQGSTREFNVPTMAMRNGDFSQLYDSAGRYMTLYDPLSTTTITAANGRTVSSRVPFVGNQIPVSRRSPLATFIYDITPAPTDITNPLVAANLKMPVPLNSAPNLSDNPATARLDHRLTSNDNFFIKFNGGSRPQYYQGTQCATCAPTVNNEANMSYLVFDALAGALSWTHVFSPSLFAETLVNRTAQSSRTVTGPEDVNWSARLGLPNPWGAVGFPKFTSIGLMNYGEYDSRRALRSMVTNAEQNFTLIKRTHNLQFGWRYHFEKQHLLNDQGTIPGSAQFNSLATALESSTSGSATSPAATAQTGYDGANFFLGYAARFDSPLNRGMFRLNDRNYGLYLQDSYKIGQRLTLTPGVRWDMNPAFTEDHYLLNAFDVKSHSVMLGQPLEYYYKQGFTNPQAVSIFDKIGMKFISAKDAGRSPNIFPSNWFDIGPRLGFAYKALEGRRVFVVRGGFGMYFSPVPMRSLLSQFYAMPPFLVGYTWAPNVAGTSPDGISNYLLRKTPTVVAGVNSANIIDLSSPGSVGRGQTVVGLADDFPTMKIYEWNLSLEKELKRSTVVRLRYNGKHGIHSDQSYNINPSQVSNYVWYARTGQSLPAGEYASVARRPYDQTTYADVRIIGKTGYINTSILSAEVERRFTQGIAFQAFYTLTNGFRLAGNSTRDGVQTLAEAYLPGAVPEDFDVRNRALWYQRDTGVPQHRVRWNWNMDVPVGKGKRLAGNAPGWLNYIVGGWKFSGSGTIVSSWYSMPTNNWGEMSNFEVYGKKYQILDCRGTPANATRREDERCLPGYLYFNGYISNRYINATNAAGLRTGIFGLPENYHPAQKPITPWPVNGKTSDPNSADYDTNIVYLRLNNQANLQRETYDNGLHPWRQQYLLGPMNWTVDGSLLKFFPIGERVRLRANFDVFNAFNVQGTLTPTAEGISSLASSYGGFGMKPRQVQVTLRLEW